MTTSNPESDGIFAVLAEANEYDRPLIQTGLPFGRLIDEIIVPYQEDEAFFVDGAPLTKIKIKKLKILRQNDSCQELLNNYYWEIRNRTGKEHKHLAEQFMVRVEAILRESGDDITAQVIKAFDTKIKPSLKEYLPKREELISAAMRFFVESLKSLGST